ncbi:serine hydrolase domain-containing protein [Agromyces soli]
MRAHRSIPIIALALVAGASLVGCTAAQAGDATPTPTAVESGLPSIDTAAVESAFEAKAEELGVPGAVLLLRTPDGEFTASYGARGLDDPTPPTVDDHVRIGSNTKTMTGTVILQLVEEGKLSLDDPVSKYRPDVPNGDAITIEQLLTMRSGLHNYTEMLPLNQGLDDDPQRVWQPEELIAMGLSGEPYFAPGEGWHYSNTNTVLLGRIAEQLDGEPLPQIFERRLFEPLGLERTSLPELEVNTLPEPFAYGYAFGTNVETMTDSRLDDATIAAARDGSIAPTDHTEDNPSWAWAAGSGISTATELADWVEALVGGELLGDELQQARLDSPQPREPGSAAAGYGWAMAKFGDYYGHTGELPGYNSFMGHDPETGVTVVVWANLAPTPEGEDPASVIARDVIDVIG